MQKNSTQMTKALLVTIANNFDIKWIEIMENDNFVVGLLSHWQLSEIYMFCFGNVVMVCTIIAEENCVKKIKLSSNRKTATL